MLFQNIWINYIGNWHRMRIRDGTCKFANITIGSDCHITNGMQHFIVNDFAITNATLKPINISSNIFEKSGQMINSFTYALAKRVPWALEFLAFGKSNSGLEEHRPMQSQQRH